MLPCLAEIVLDRLQNLGSFFPRNAIIKYPSLVKVEIKDCNRLKNWGYETHDTPNLEKQIANVINANWQKPGAPQQQGQALPPQHMQSQQPHYQSHNKQISSQMQTGNMQGSMGGMQQNNMGSMQQNLIFLLQGSSNTPQNIMRSLQQVSGRSLLQNAESGPQKVNMNPMLSHSGMGIVQPNSNMIDKISGSTPGNESRAAVGEDLVAMTESHLQARTSDTQDGTNGVRKMKHCAMPLNVLSLIYCVPIRTDFDQRTTD